MGVSYKLKHPVTEKPIALNEMLSHIDGYLVGTQRRSLYEDVEQMVYKQLSVEFDERTLENIKQITRELDALPSHLHRYILSKQDRLDIHPEEFSTLKELAYLVFPQKQEDLGLYTMVVYPEQIKERYTEKERILMIKEIEHVIGEIDSITGGSE